MTGTWTYPWTLSIEGVDEACRRISGAGFDAIHVPSHYHSVRTFHPRFPAEAFASFPGGCYFDLDAEDAAFETTPIVPPRNEVEGFDDPLADVVAAAHDHGLDANAWTVCLHNSRLGATNPTYRVESALGDPQDHALCPSHPEVREYIAAVARAAVDRGVDAVHLESIGYPTVFHGHGSTFGHDKRAVDLPEVAVVLLSQCFCDGCHAAAADHDVDLECAADRVRELVHGALTSGSGDLESIADLVEEDPVLAELFEFRAETITRLVERIADATGAVPLSYYVAEAFGGSTPGEAWPAGVELERLVGSLDRVVAMCYLSDPDAAGQRAERLAALVDVPVDAGVTIDHRIVERETDLHDVVDAVRTVIDGEVSVYNDGIASATRLEWAARAAGGVDGPSHR